MVPVTWLLIPSFLPLCLSGPVPRDDRDANATTGWVQDPNGRGTSGLLISCVLTLGLCVWSAMHLNIPPKSDSNKQWWARSIKWAALGVIIPELVILSAWRQWLSARKMSKELKIIFKKHDDDGRPPRRFEWTTTHSYYAGMGGFVFDPAFIPTTEGKIFVDTQRMTLTASGVLLLAKCGHLPDIDKEYITDKSKADGLGKALVLLQATWMVLQTLGRLIVKQPITLLEINTLGHIFCAFVIYVLWWRKPKEVHAATVLEGLWTRPLAAYMYMSSRMSGKKPEGMIVLKHWIKPELSEFNWVLNSGGRTLSSGSDGPSITSCKDKSSEQLVTIRRMESKDDQSYPSISLDGTLQRRLKSTPTEPLSTVINITRTETDSPRKAAREIQHRACAEAISLYEPIRELFRADESSTSLKPTLLPLVAEYATNWPGDFYLPGISGQVMGMALWLSSMLYGGIHIAAWEDFFPTYLERMLWRFSACFIAASGAFWLGCCIVAYHFPMCQKWYHRFVELRAHKFEYVLIGTCAFVCGAAYIFGRFFLVIDAIVSLRRLPLGAYDTPDWSSIFPHM